jgi:hypothetical protein
VVFPCAAAKESVWEDFKENIGGEMAEDFRQAKEEWETVDPVYCVPGL